MSLLLKAIKRIADNRMFVQDSFCPVFSLSDTCLARASSGCLPCRAARDATQMAGVAQRGGAPGARTACTLVLQSLDEDHSEVKNSPKTRKQKEKGMFSDRK